MIIHYFQVKIRIDVVDCNTVDLPVYTFRCEFAEFPGNGGVLNAISVGTELIDDTK